MFHGSYKVQLFVLVFCGKYTISVLQIRPVFFQSFPKRDLSLAMVIADVYWVRVRGQHLASHHHLSSIMASDSWGTQGHREAGGCRVGSLPWRLLSVPTEHSAGHQGGTQWVSVLHMKRRAPPTDTNGDCEWQGICGVERKSFKGRSFLANLW